ncbi:MAG: dihydroneopterin aldolase [Bacteroidota bacterium]|nr:dihydroneopterin aldolase [Bacteroidota bacterium]
MGLIEVNDIRVFGYHGCLDEEGRIGAQYRVYVSVEGDFEKAEHSDKLSETVDYARVAAIVKEQMAVRSKLIEHVCRRIMDALKTEWGNAYGWKVKLVKERPPVHGDVDHVSYTIGE